jgi:tape measure domain-containing protein
MASVDDRIVRIEFDNSSFEKKLDATMKSLANLEKSLQFKGATQGFSDINAAANKVDMSHISAGIEGVSKKFLALSTIAITALATITQAAIRTGTQLIKSLTIDPILAGFQEFETNLNSIQTILANTASKGTTLDQVNDALQKLNVYSDQTIFNFGEMARNIGTFTAAGVDLQTSVDSIKGIANLAALSGSNAQQAASAMYQLSQAIATGSLKLIDWNSVVNAGMGGEVFKNALFQTAKAMHTITDIPMDTTLKQWEDAGNSFRDSLQDGWITAEVLTTTLQGFTGDMTEEMLLQKGFSEQQARDILKTAQIAKAAATEVKTFTQLMGTVKEAVGTGFADSFRILIGNFNESKTLFTGINNAIGGFVSRTSDARNAILQQFKDLGGRAIIIQDLENAFKNLGAILAPIRDAFRSIFPPITAETLLNLTGMFTRFVNSLAPLPDTVEKLRHIFAGFFAALSIGWTILKEGVGFLKDLAKQLLGIISPEATDFLVTLADKIVELRDALVKGEGIKKFFDGLARAVQVPLDVLRTLKAFIGGIFSSFNKEDLEAVEDGFGRLAARFDTVKAAFEKVASLWEPFHNFLVKVKEILDNVWEAIRSFFEDLGPRIAKFLDKADFNEVLDVINTGLLGAITLLIGKFLSNGFNVNITSAIDLGGGLLRTLNRTFGELTNTLKAMQTQIKAQALLKIAAAIGILTASVLVLSLIDSEALSKALAAMAIGFGQLMGAFAILSKLMLDPKSAASFTILSTGMILIATALLILSLAVRSFATLDAEELAIGLAGVTGALGILIVTSKPLAANSKGMVAAGVGVTAIAIALTILAGAVKLFGLMDWEELAKGMVSIGVLLGLLAAAMNLMPPSPVVIAQGVAMIAIAIALNILAGAVAIFGSMDLETLGKGLGAVAVGLGIIAGAMQLMPPTMVANAAALVLVGIALNEIGGAMKILATMSWEEIAKGLVAMAGALGIIAAAMFAMQSAIPGAVALTIVAFALGVLVAVLKTFELINFEDLLESLGKMALALGVIAAVALLLSEAIPVILALGIALSVLGVAFALFGAGIFLIGKGLAEIARSGEAASKNIVAILSQVGKALPALLSGFARGLIDFVKIITDAAPVFAKAIGALLEAMITQLEKLVPKVGPLIVLALKEIFRVIRSYAAQLIDLGFFIVNKLLQGIEKNIGPIVQTVGNIITNFLAALSKEIPRIAKGFADVIITAITSAAEQLGRIASTIMFGVALAFMNGFLQGLDSAVGPIIDWFAGLANKIFGWIGDVFGTLISKGSDLISGFWQGVQDVWGTVTEFFSGIGGEIKGLIGDAFNWLKDAGEQVVSGFWQGIRNIWGNIVDWVKRKVDDLIHTITHPWEIFSPSHLMNRLGQNIMKGWLLGLKDGFADVDNFISNLNAVDTVTNMGNNMTKALARVSDSMGDSPEFNPVITPVLDLTQVSQDASRISNMLPSAQMAMSSTKTSRQIAIERKAAWNDAHPGEQSATPTGVSFEQNIYAPTRLSTSDIYKQTRNQITVAKEELSIP